MGRRRRVRDENVHGARPAFGQYGYRQGDVSRDSGGTWLPFIDRDLYDMPRAIFVVHEGTASFLECSFDEGLDEYQMTSRCTSCRPPRRGRPETRECPGSG
jgi:hypothetical protein